MDITDLQPKSLDQLRGVAREWNIPTYSRLKKDDLIIRLLRAVAEKQGLELRGGVLDIVEDGIGFLRAEHLMPGAEDIYVSQSQIRRFGLRTGDMVIGQVRAPKDSEKYFGLLRVETVNGLAKSCPRNLLQVQSGKVTIPHPEDCPACGACVDAGEGSVDLTFEPGSFVFFFETDGSISALRAMREALGILKGRFDGLREGADELK